MIPGRDIPFGDREFLTEAGRKEWHRFVDVLEHRVLDVGSTLIMDYADALSYPGSNPFDVSL